MKAYLETIVFVKTTEIANAIQVVVNLRLEWGLPITVADVGSSLSEMALLNNFHYLLPLMRPLNECRS